MDPDIVTSVTQIYSDAFAAYFSRFVEWGKMLFGGLLILNMGWLFLWYAFDKASITQGISAFLKRFFIVLLFYSIMVNPDWLKSIMTSSHTMGSLLVGAYVDPSSLLKNGVSLANKIIIPIAASSLLTLQFSAIVALICYLGVLFVFIRVALMLAVTMIMATAMISVSSFFLGFAALGATSQIARQSLDVVLGLCVKLLGLYMVIGVGSKSLHLITASIPTSVLSLDGYAYVIAGVGLFWLVAKNLPEQIAKVVTGSIQETRGTDAAAITMAALRFANQSNQAIKIAQVATSASGVPVAIAAAKNAAAHFSSADSGLTAKTAGALMGVAKDTAKAGLGTVGDHFKHLSSKLSGGGGMAGGVAGMRERLNQASATLKNKPSIDALKREV
jgi:type IV secretory pathway TrbL component